ncbi:prepilin-type N-terminal cleavage/methylation domain-containing protein [Elusimicrobium posterum]|uniref:pilin n=1 Tax=Elusimicrobium posterum TaxID=3116653 RepID=UPI003C7606C2
MKKGFTLIELLVVVLIIGILAAIALPQYNKAVEKSRLSEALINSKAILDSMERAILSGAANGDIEGEEVLDIGLSGGTWSYNGYQTKYFSYSPIRCYDGFCETMQVSRVGTNAYMLEYTLNNGVVTKNCYTNDTDVGRGICKGLQGQGYSYQE